MNFSILSNRLIIQYTNKVTNKERVSSPPIQCSRSSIPERAVYCR